LVVLEPYYKALETARRCAELGRELGISQVFGVANKLRGPADRDAVRNYAAAHGLRLVAEVPFDDEIARADLAGPAPAEGPERPAGRAVASLVDTLHLGDSSP